MNISLKKYWINDMHMGWDKSSGSREGLRFFMESSSFATNGVVLDAGAGDLRFKPFFEKSIYLSQEHPAGIKFKNMENIDYDLISPLDEIIPLKNNCLDLIISNSVIEHIRYPEKFLAEAYRVLKPGGKIYISVPFFAFEHETPYDFQRPTRFGLESWLKTAGLTQVKITPNSTCTANITFFLPIAAVYDCLRTNKNPKTVLSESYKSKKYFQFMKILILFLIAGFLYFSLLIFSKLLNMFINIKPYEDANMPSGWFAIATKPGNHIQSKYKNKQEFLKKCKCLFK